MSRAWDVIDNALSDEKIMFAFKEIVGSYEK